MKLLDWKSAKQELRANKYYILQLSLAACPPPVSYPIKTNKSIWTSKWIAYRLTPALNNYQIQK